jgi:hypothetical protein
MKPPRRLSREMAGTSVSRRESMKVPETIKRLEAFLQSESTLEKP